MAAARVAGKLPASFVCLHEAVYGASSKRRPTWLPPCIVVGIRGFAEPYVNAARDLAGACLACAANCAGGDGEYPQRPPVCAAAAPDYKVWLSGQPGIKCALPADTHRQRLRTLQAFFERIIEWPPRAVASSASAPRCA